MNFGNDIPNQRNSRFTRQPQEELQFAKFLLNHAADAAFWLEPDARFIYVNDVAQSELGYSREELLSLTIYDVAPDLAAEVWSEQWRSLNQHTITFVSRGNCSTARMDKKLLQPILTNLLENAVKYSPPGSTVDLELSCEDGDAIFLLKDAGIGIPDSDQQRLFEPFHRGSNVGDVPGTGLGLAVVKKLVDLHGGQIAVTSVVGVGTTFTVKLPLES